MNTQKPNCFEKTEAGGAFFIFHHITDEHSNELLHPLAYNVLYMKRAGIWLTALRRGVQLKSLTRYHGTQQPAMFYILCCKIILMFYNGWWYEKLPIAAHNAVKLPPKPMRGKTFRTALHRQFFITRFTARFY